MSYNHRWINSKDKIEYHAYKDFEIIYEFHGAEGNDSKIAQCKKCGRKVKCI